MDRHHHDDDGHREDGTDRSSSSSLGSGDISSPWPSSSSTSSSGGHEDGDDGSEGDDDGAGSDHGTGSSSVASSSASASSSSRFSSDDASSVASSYSGSSATSQSSYRGYHDVDIDTDPDEGDGLDENGGGSDGRALQSMSRSNNNGSGGSSSGLLGLVKTATSSSSSPLFDDYGVAGGAGNDREDEEEELAVAATRGLDLGGTDDGRDGDGWVHAGRSGETGDDDGGERKKEKCPSPFTELERRSTELTRRRRGGTEYDHDEDGGYSPSAVSTGAAPNSPVRRRRRGTGDRANGTRRNKPRRGRYKCDERYHDGDDDLSCSEHLPPALRCLVRLLPPCPKFCTSNMCLLAASAFWFVAQVRFHAYMFPPSSSSTSADWGWNDRPSRRRGGTNNRKSSVHDPSPEKLTRKQAEALRRERREEAESALGSAAAARGTNEAFSGIKKPPKNVRKSRKGRKDAGVEKLSEECEYSEWQTYDFPVCNSLHEIDLTTALGMRKGMDKLHGDLGVGGDFSNVDEDAVEAEREATRVVATEGHKTRRAKGLFFPGDDNGLGGNGADGGMGYLGSGLWRNVWRIPDNNLDYHSSSGGGGGASSPGGGVLKMMKMDHPVDERNFDRHRRDALTMERLTSDPHVTTPFGYCGNTVFADCVGCSSPTNPRGLDEVIYLDSPVRKEMDRRRREVGGATRSTEVGRLRLALDVARGLRALHSGVPGGGPPIAHADIQAKQFLLDERGRVVINDFNRCRFVPFRKKKENGNVNGNVTDANVRDEADGADRGTSSLSPEYCPFRIATAPGTSRSPEEYKSKDLTEKIDVFSAGHVLYGILTGRKSFANSKKGNPLETKKKIKRGETPRIDEARDVGGRRGDAVLAGLVERMYLMDPGERISASDLVDELERALASALDEEANRKGKSREDESQQLKGEPMIEDEGDQMAGLGRGRTRYGMGGQNSSLR